MGDQFEIKHTGKYCRLGSCYAHLEKLCKAVVDSMILQVFSDVSGLYIACMRRVTAEQPVQKGFLQEQWKVLQQKE